jgi:voltage-gated potassium channel
MVYNPRSHIKKIWQFIVFICAVYAAVVIPLMLLFDLPQNESCHWVITVVFILDFLYNIDNYLKGKKDLETSVIYANKRYPLFLLFLDLLAAVPFAILFSIPLFGMLRLVKLAWVLGYFRRFRNKFLRFSSWLVLLFFVFWVLLGIHYLSLGWIAICKPEIPVNIGTSYVDALYWVITTLTTVGYGDIVPQGNIQKIYSMFVQIMGFGIFGYVIGTVASILLKRDPAKTKYLEQVEGLTSLLHYRHLPDSLQKRIIEFYTYMWKNRIGYDETDFLNSLPENLRTEVALHLKKEVIEKISLFEEASDQFRSEIALHLKPVFLTPDDYVFRAGDSGDNMYFVVNGKLIALSSDENKILTTLESGSFFGEIALFKNQPRSATIKAVSYCDVYELDKYAFNKVIARYPQIASQIEKEVVVREQRYAN